MTTAHLGNGARRLALALLLVAGAIAGCGGSDGGGGGGGGTGTANDTTPDTFRFTDQTGVARSTTATSNTITVTGINTPTAISIVGGQYSIGGQAYTSSAGTVNNNQQVTVSLTASANYSATTEATLTIGGVSDTFSVTTVAALAPGISYSGSPFTFTQNVAITITPTLTGSAPTSCTSAPPLPAGLSLNPSSCAISGAPTVAQAATTYTITATNADGNGQANIDITVVTGAADLNGYTAEYECRAGNPNCDVNIAGLATLACDQTITTSTQPTNNWSAINWSNNVICIAAGDHTGRGTLTIQASGTPGARKVLRYTRANDSNDEPWNQGGNQARLRDLVLNGASFWVVHRLTFPASGAAATPGDYRVELIGLATDNIFSRLLVEGNSSVPSFSNQLYGGIGSTTASSHRTTIQNSVIRTNYSAGSGANCVGTPPLGNDVRLVNNEIYDWCEHNYQQGENNTPTLGGSILENNDVYYNNPSFTGHAEDNIVFKASGTAANPQRVIHNRIWGTRWATSCCDGGGGTGLFIAGQDALLFKTVNYVLVQNNIIFDNIYGVGGYPGRGTNHSIVGNLLYNHHQFNGRNDDATAFSMWGVGGLSEFYLNTVVDSDRYLDFQGANNQDIRCDVAISAGPSVPSMGGGSQIDRNVYYQTTSNGEINRIDAALNTRANATAYSVGDIIRTAAVGNCVAASNSACFLYKVTATGTSASTAPTYCTTLGCTTTDGSMTVQAVRGPYVFKRKLKTAPEDFVVPYARVHTSADEATFCTQAGTGPGIGINDDTLGTGILATDLTGLSRAHTAGALQSSSGSATRAPYPGPGPTAIPGTIELEHYDRGGQGLAYDDSSSRNEGGAYRTGTDEAVDVEVTQDTGGGHDVGWITPGEWLTYSVSVESAGTYDVDIRYAADGFGGTLHIEFDGVDKTGSISLPNTGGWQTWQTVTRTGVSLSAGPQLMRLGFDTGNAGWLANINYVRFVRR